MSQAQDIFDLIHDQNLDDDKKLLRIAELVKDGLDLNTVFYLEDDDDDGSYNRERGDTVLMRAIEEENIMIVKTLINSGASVHLQNMQHKETALMRAVKKGDYDTVKLLLDSGADVGQKDDCGTSAITIDWRGANLNLDVLKLLLEHGADVNETENGVSALVKIIPFVYDSSAVNRELHLEAFKILLDHGAEPSFQALRMAVLRSNEEMVRILLEAGVDDVNQKIEYGWGEPNDTILNSVQFCEENGFDILKLLVAYGADFNIHNSEGKSVFYEIMTVGQTRKKVEIIDWMLKNGANISLCGRRDLIFQMIYLEDDLDSSLLRVLVEHGAELDFCDPDDSRSEGRTPLMYATAREDYELVTVLLELGANPNTQDAQGRTALFFANFWFHPDKSEQEKQRVVQTRNIPRLLVHHGAYINWQDVDGLTPLMTAVFNCRPEVFNTLLELGANFLDITNNDGETAVSIAFKTMADGVIKEYKMKGKLSERAENHLKETSDNVRKAVLEAFEAQGGLDRMKKTALMLAIISKNTRVAKKLIEEGADIVAMDSFKVCPLFYAGVCEEYEIANILINIGGGELKRANYVNYCKGAELAKQLKQNK